MAVEFSAAEAIPRVAGRSARHRRGDRVRAAAPLFSGSALALTLHCTSASSDVAL